MFRGEGKFSDVTFTQTEKNSFNTTLNTKWDATIYPKTGPLRASNSKSASASPYSPPPFRTVPVQTPVHKHTAHQRQHQQTKPRDESWGWSNLESDIGYEGIPVETCHVHQREEVCGSGCRCRRILGDQTQTRAPSKWHG
mmetsp:Transcript_14188/g.17402  ORF Transcript_14188/g.17402 Transcript_14188/m.17402 type:complete len:140 (+) Transcript_14188:86-505(+)